MRKVMLLALLAASVAAPATAMAQEDGWRGRQDGRPSRSERPQVTRENRVERQETRQENRVERQQARQENRQERQQARQERQQQPVVQQRQERRQERAAQSGNAGTEWIGDRNDPRMEEHRRRYERLDRQNARRNGSQEQYRDLVREQGSQREARREERRDDRRDWRNDRRDNRQDWRNGRRDDRRDWRNDRRDDRRDWNRGWRNDNRYDWQRYRNSNRFVFRIQPYYSPYRGYGYNRFSIGNVLDRLFWGQNYWISDPWTYRLPPAPYGYQWVRYYNDVVLVDTYNGEIVDVIYDFFW